MHVLNQVQFAGTDELLKIWVARYLPELGAISNQVKNHVENRLRLTITDESRLATYHQIISHLISDCDHAATDTKKLLLAVGLPPDSWEMQELSTQTYKIYETLMDCYAASFIFSPILEHLHILDSEAGKLKATALVIPKFESLIQIIGPQIRDLKAMYFSSVNRHLVGFMTTHMHFTRQSILHRLDPYEHIWLAPYLQLLDELICIPWQRICSVASTNTSNPNTIALVRRMIPKVHSISSHTYQKTLRAYPNHISCQGRIQSSAVQHSVIRDINMLQAYIWLCVLEDSVAVIEKQLLPICLQVFSLTDVDWDIVTFGIQTIVDMIQQQLTPSEQNLFEKHANTIESLFLNAKL
ncbi:hypothetical protein [Leptothoe sp. PORK10 BA2]|uniref:hypothetical protein n=1 Tax=Leptothoe sp. PORK10 BA2 TaxID=3110254 RepID=UPI002B1E9B9B|nr:hypothetical protein [Leptothoe sp. PORK10 BA2]MEA5464928.1 hypothetical protein [Leptothoe sp. PORK10 BA2]